MTRRHPPAPIVLVVGFQYRPGGPFLPGPVYPATDLPGALDCATDDLADQRPWSPIASAVYPARVRRHRDATTTLVRLPGPEARHLMGPSLTPALGYGTGGLP